MPLVEFAATFDSTALVEMVGGNPRKLIGLVRGLDESWEVRGADDVIPSVHGRNPRDRKRDRLVIELAGDIMGIGATDDEQRADIRVCWEELRTLFDNTAAPATLEVVLEDGGTATIEARPVNIIPGPLTLAVARAVSIELEAVGDAWDVTPGGS